MKEKFKNKLGIGLVAASIISGGNAINNYGKDQHLDRLDTQAVEYVANKIFNDYKELGLTTREGRALFFKMEDDKKYEYKNIKLQKDIAGLLLNYMKNNGLKEIIITKSDYLYPDSAVYMANYLNNASHTKQQMIDKGANNGITIDDLQNILNNYEDFNDAFKDVKMPLDGNTIH